MNEIAKQIFEKIEKADSIVIFGHKSPDGDCVGSVMGMKYALSDYFPKKHIYAVGTHPEYLGRDIDKSDEVSDEVIASSLALLVDLSDLKRVEDQRINMAKEIVCVDHHVPDKDEYEFLVYREVDAHSATYILAKLLFERYGHICAKASKYLFLGLVTDTGRFQFDCEQDTLEIGGKLISNGVDYKALYRELYRQNSKDLRYRAFIYNHFAFSGLVTYCCVSKKEYEALGLEQNEASGKVNLLSLLDDHPIWAFFSEQNDGTIRVELRSDGRYNMQKVAKQFNGGGHIPASGCTLSSFDRVKDVLEALNKAELIA